MEKTSKKKGNRSWQRPEQRADILSGRLGVAVQTWPFYLIPRQEKQISIA
jgi:outer membrane phospholipase A